MILIPYELWLNRHKVAAAVLKELKRLQQLREE